MSRNAGAAAPDSFAPIFVVGFPRSGTTLLATQLSRHSAIAVPPETRFMADVADSSRQRAQMLARLAASRRCRDLELNHDLLAARFNSVPANYAWLFRILLESYAKDQGKPRVAEKSPIHLLHLPTLAAWYPEARFVLTVRDGRDCALSLRDAPWAHDDLLRHAAEWRRRMSRVRRWQPTLGTRLQVVRFEDLVQEPESSLRAVMAFLDLPFEPMQLQTGDDSTAIPAWEQDWKGKATQPPDPSRVAVWKRKADPRALAVMESVMGRELRAWGYAVTPSPLHPRAALLGAFYSSGLFKALQRLARLGRAAKRDAV